MASSTQARKQLFENIVRLRRAERESSGSRDIGAVRKDLERQLGGTVSRSLAAQVLGVSHTALNRWIEAGDVPVVVTREGRKAVPVSALVDLHEAINQERESDQRLRHRLEPEMRDRRNRADNLHPAELVSEEARTDDPHRTAELRSLAYHRAIARRLRRPMAEEALNLVLDWRKTGKIDARHADEWERILRSPIPEIRKVLRDDGQLARDLRQSSPFAGMLSEPERRKIVADVR